MYFAMLGSYNYSLFNKGRLDKNLNYSEILDELEIHNDYSVDDHLLITIMFSDDPNFDKDRLKKLSEKFVEWANGHNQYWSKLTNILDKIIYGNTDFNNIDSDSSESDESDD